jgi:hypothetical protein
MIHVGRDGDIHWEFLPCDGSGSIQTESCSLDHLIEDETEEAR